MRSAAAVVTRVNLVILAMVSSLLIISCEDAPTPEYARAKEAYTRALGETADVTYRGARWDEVLALLRAVPTSNQREHSIAQKLAEDIEGTRARIAAEMKKNEEVAGKLLDLPSLPPIDAAPPASTTAAKASDAPVDNKPTLVGKALAQQKCIDECTSAFMSCMKSAGCTTQTSSTTATGTKSSYSCPGDAALKGLACGDNANACNAKCQQGG